jgi:hypothetical protein
LVLVVLVSVSAVLVAPRLCGVTEPQRHGLACDIPLPPNATFDREAGLPAGGLGSVASQSLEYHVANTTPDAIRSFYTQHLPSDGWKCVNGDVPLVISAEQGKRGLNIVVLPPDTSVPAVTVIISILTFTKDFDTHAC